MRRKKYEAELIIDSIEFPGVGVANFEGNKVYIKNTLPMQKLKVSITKRRRKYEGIVLEKIEKGTHEIEPLCKHFSSCGGCTFQNIPYEYELQLKKQMVSQILNIDVDILQSGTCKQYRNKMEFSFGDEEKDGLMALGMRKRNSFYEVVTSKDCNIIDENIKQILLETLNFFANTTEKFYHKGNRTGALRHLIVRKGEFTNEVFVNLVTTSSIKQDLFLWATRLLELKINIVGISNTINDSIGDVVKNDEFRLLYGQNFFYESLLGLKFKIYPFAFFQTNSIGAEVLYSTIKNFISGAKDKIIFDLYCGTGTIAQILSTGAKKVIGIEIVEEAITAATENAKLNNISNCEFIVGDVLNKVDELCVKPDIIILDPPREGINPKAIGKIINFNCNEIVYVSCKPTSLERDLKIFIDNGYFVSKIKCVDMFPRTYHVETIVLLCKL